MNLIKTKNFELAVNVKGDPDSRRLAIICPGRLDTKDYRCFDSHIEFLAGKGFYAVALDPPGTWESRGGIELFTTTNYIKAVNELIEFYGNKPALLVGHSRGGAVANIVGTNNSNVIGIVTIMASLGVPSLPDKQDIKGGVNVDFRDLPPGDKKTIQQKRFEVPLAYFKDGQNYNDAEVLKGCMKPKLMFYGTEDEFNSTEEVREVFDAIPEPKELHELKCNHDYRYYPEIVKEVNRGMGLFIDRFFKT